MRPLTSLLFVFISYVASSPAIAATGASASSYGEHAADSHYDAEAMATARASVRRMHGGMTDWMVLAERLEVNADDELTWEAEAWYGGQLNRIWLKTDGEADLADGRTEEAELQALYSRAIRPFWDLQLGLRHDFRPTPARTHGVITLKGLAPYLFELDTALFLSETGTLSGRIEAEYEFRLSQRLFLQPRAEIDFAFNDDEAAGVGSGVGEVELGLRLRYEFRRDLAPYLGYQWTRRYGQTADLADEVRSNGAVLGIRFWL